MDKLVIVGAPGTIDARLATSTLFDLLGDPSLWPERYEILLRTDGNGAELPLPDWAGPLVDLGLERITDFTTLDREWTVLGPTNEGLVLEAMSVGAKYLALDDGLVELLVEDETSVEVVPDTTEKKEEEVSAEAVESVSTVESPTEPVKRGRGRPRKNPLPDTKPTLVPAAKDKDKPKPPVATQLPAEPTDAIRDRLRGLIDSLLADADTDKLWKVIDSLRKI